MKLLRRAILAIALSAGLAPAFAQVPPPVPALPDTERRTAYSITGSQCSCAVNFALLGDSTDYNNWVEVFLNGVRVNNNDATFGWTITSPSGSLANLPRPISNAVLTFNVAQTGTVQIVGARRPRRASQFAENRGVPARDLNLVITDLTAQNRETWDKLNDVTGRTVQAPPGETLAMLPPLANRRNLGACFDNSGNLTSCISVPSTTIAAGNGIGFSGTNPTTIALNFATYTGVISESSLTGVNTPLRIPLSGSTTIYVNAMGAPAACGVTGALTCGIGSSNPANPTNAATPFATVQQAIAFIAKSVDAQSQAITINLAHGASADYGFTCIGQPLLGQITFNVVGDYSNPTAVTAIGQNSAFAIRATDQCVPSLSSFKITDQGSSAGAIFAEQQGIIDLRSMTIGSWNTGGAAIVAIDGGKVNLLGQDSLSSITNTLDGTAYGQTFQAQYGGIVDFRSQQIAVPNAITIGGGQPLAMNIAGYMKGLRVDTFTGAGTAGTTGNRCAFTTGAVSNIDPNTAFIGNVDCYSNVWPRKASIHLAGTNETWVPPATNVYHLFIPNAVKYNDGSLWKAVGGGIGSAFVPPAGAPTITLKAQIWATSGVAATGSFVAKWIKNANADATTHNLTTAGTEVCAGVGTISDAGSGTAIMRADCDDKPSPGDYYNLFLFIDSTTLGTTTVVVEGNPAHTYVQAHVTD